MTFWPTWLDLKNLANLNISFPLPNTQRQQYSIGLACLLINLPRDQINLPCTTGLAFQIAPGHLLQHRKETWPEVRASSSANPCKIIVLCYYGLPSCLTSLFTLSGSYGKNYFQVYASKYLSHWGSSYYYYRYITQQQHCILLYFPKRTFKCYFSCGAIA